MTTSTDQPTTYDHDPARDAAWDRMSTLGAHSVDLFLKTDWAMDAGVIAPADVPQPVSADDFTDWLDRSGVTAAWTKASRPAHPCPPWCAGEHKTRVGPNQIVAHRAHPLGLATINVDSAVDGPTTITLGLACDEEYDDDALAPAVMSVGGFDLYLRDAGSAERLGQALVDAGQRWRSYEEETAD